MFLLGTQRINDRGHLEIGGCDTVDLARTYGTPLYVLDEALIRANCRAFRQAFGQRYPQVEIAYAGKAFLTTAMARIVAQEGLALDVASAGELYTALRGGFPPERIFFHGNNKSPDELALALAHGVGRIVVDNLYELDLLGRLAAETGRTADILIRTAPGIDPHTHHRIRTGQADTKFGLSIADGAAMTAVKRALALPGVRLRGLHAHVGSQLLDTRAHEEAADIVLRFAREVADETGYVIEELNLGGGLGIRYLPEHRPPTIDEFAEALVGAVRRALAAYTLPAPRLQLEPGRAIVSEAGTTLYTVGAIKRVSIPEPPGERLYVTIDGGMSDNPRPQLYDAKYTALLANKADRPAVVTARIAGKHCETDILIQSVPLAEPEPGDILAVLATGAYNYSMASNYNRFPRPAVVLVADGRAEVIVKRETLDDLLRQDVIPPRLWAAQP